MKKLLPILLLSLLGCTQSTVTPKTTSRLIIGTATNDEYRSGIFIYDFDHSTLTATLKSETQIIDPSFMRFSSDGERLYSVSERGAQLAELVEFSYDATSAELDSLSAARCLGAFPCHLYLEDDWAVTANYGGGSLSLFDINDGVKLSRRIEFNSRDTSRVSHLHCFMPSPDSNYFFATDLGHDSIYRFEREVGSERIKELSGAVALKGGSGPRHIIFNPSGDKLYLINELSGSVVGYKHNDGELREFTVAQSDSVGGGGSADIHFSPDGEFLYASNRLKSDGISIFSVAADGTIEKIGYRETSSHPRNFTLSADGSLLLVACRDGNVVEIFRRDTRSGLLSDVVATIEVESPLFVNWIPEK